MANNDLLVLRFRDIEVELDETISEHQVIISDKGSVWWGWLKRPYEQISIDYFTELNSQLEAGPMEVALYDTGQQKVFKTTCAQIEFTSFPQPTPDYNLTPAYYNSKQTYVWLQLTSIIEMDSSYIIGRSCVSMPSATDECAIDLVGSEVTRLGELRRQEVTMWVLSSSEKQSD